MKLVYSCVKLWKSCVKLCRVVCNVEGFCAVMCSCVQVCADFKSFFFKNRVKFCKSDVQFCTTLNMFVQSCESLVNLWTDLSKYVEICALVYMWCKSSLRFSTNCNSFVELCTIVYSCVQFCKVLCVNLVKFWQVF